MMMRSNSVNKSLNLSSKDTSAIDSKQINIDLKKFEDLIAVKKEQDKNQPNTTPPVVVTTLCLTPKLYKRLKQPAVQQTIKIINVSIKTSKSKEIAEQYLQLKSQGKIMLIAKQAPVDSIAIGKIAFLCRYRTQPHSIKNTQKLADWHKNMKRGDRCKILLENGNYVFYSPQPQSFSDSLRAMLNILVKQKWQGNYIALFLPRSLQKQFFLLNLISQINSFDNAITNRFQFIVFETKPNSNFQPILSNLQHSVNQLFTKQWFWVNENGQQISFSYRNCKYIENNKSSKVKLVVDLDSSFQSKAVYTHRLQVNSGTLQVIKSSQRSQVYFNGTKIVCQLIDNTQMQLLAQYNQYRAFRTFIARQQQIKTLIKNRQQMISTNCFGNFFSRFIPPINREQIIKQKGQEWIQLRLQCIELDKNNMTQRNMFTGYIRKVNCYNFNQQQFVRAKKKHFKLVELQTTQANQKNLNRLLQTFNLY